MKLETLVNHIAAQLVVRGFCLVFDDDLERCWPSNQMPQAERSSEIDRFAESQGWSATILEGCVPVISKLNRADAQHKLKGQTNNPRQQRELPK